MLLTHRRFYDENMMKANPEKFQNIIFNRNKKYDI